MHLVLKQETTRPPGANLLQQQERFDRFVETYNLERPHEALGQKPPATVYAASPRPMPEIIPEPEYPLHDATVRVYSTGMLQLTRREGFRLTSALNDQLVGIREVEGDRWLISFMAFDLGHYDMRTKRFTPNALPLEKKGGDLTDAA
jgi:hypothetical protein